jgi:hypothetical protein
MGFMAKEPRIIEITDVPELLKLAEELEATQQPIVLRRNNRDVAVLSPAPKRPRTKRSRAFTKDDALFGLIGIGESPGPTDVSTQKHKYILEAYRKKHAK